MAQVVEMNFKCIFLVAGHFQGHTHTHTHTQRKETDITKGAGPHFYQKASHMLEGALGLGHLEVVQQYGGTYPIH